MNKYGKGHSDMTSVERKDHIKWQVVESISGILSNRQRWLNYLEIIFKFELKSCLTFDADF